MIADKERASRRKARVAPQQALAKKAPPHGKLYAREVVIRELAETPALRKARSTKLPVKVSEFRNLLRTAGLPTRVRLEREGVPFKVVVELIDDIGVSATDFQRFVGIPKATYTKKVKDKALFSGTSGQAVLGVLELINKVEDMVKADPEADTREFDVERWVGHWIQRPQPALGGMAPAELLDTPSGRESVLRVLGAIQSGAYQ